MSVRKMITFPERGAQLLAEATGNARERAAGEYISAVLAQRRRAWRLALQELLDTGASPAEILEAIREVAGLNLSADSMVPRVAHLQLIGTDAQAESLHTLVLEYEAQNRALLDALDNGETTP